MKRTVGFTLIELLIVVAIIAILAAIATPNFLEAQMRSKVTRAKADMRTLATGLEAYRTDNQAYPITIIMPPPFRLLPLTTPVSYLSSLPNDIFKTDGPEFFNSRGYNYRATSAEVNRWALTSNGPDRQVDAHPGDIYPGYSPELFTEQLPDYTYRIYDPTNGTVSRGDIFRVSDHQFE